MGAQDGRTLPVLRACKLEVQESEERWLIDGLWARNAIGLVGGAPKCCKSWFGLEMAVSVASGTPALGHFPCATSGAVLVYLAEDSLPQVRDRVEALCKSRGLDIAVLDLHVITASSLRIDLAGDQARLAATIEALRPRLLVLDPLVRIHRLDENSSSEISGLLGYIRDLQRRFDVAVVLVHHASKKARAQPGQALRGSSDLHAIGDSNAYLARRGDRLLLTLEHRAARSPEPMEIELVVDPEQDTAQLRVCEARVDPASLRERKLADDVLELLAREGRALPRTEIRSLLRVNNQRLGDVLDQLACSGAIHRSSDGWARS
ncbi:MAG: AAA family ATPase [bacterium]|nr:AAA family ATPase [bacterium]